MAYNNGEPSELEEIIKLQEIITENEERLPESSGQGVCFGRSRLLIAGVVASAVMLVIGYGAIGHRSSLLSAKSLANTVGLEEADFTFLNSKIKDAKEGLEGLMLTPPEMHAILSKDGALEKLNMDVLQMHSLSERLREGNYSNNASFNRHWDLLTLIALAKDAETLIDDEQDRVDAALTEDTGDANSLDSVSSVEGRDLFGLEFPDSVSNVEKRVPNPVQVSNHKMGVMLTLKRIKGDAHEIGTTFEPLLKWDAKRLIGMVCNKGVQEIQAKGQKFCRRLGGEAALYCEGFAGGPEDPIGDVCAVAMDYAVTTQCVKEVQAQKWPSSQCKAAGEKMFEKAWKEFIGGHQGQCRDYKQNFQCPGASWESNCADHGSKRVCMDPRWGVCWRLHCKGTCQVCRR